MIHHRWLLLGASIGLTAACGGAEFTLDDAGASAGTAGASSVVTTGSAGSGVGGSNDGTSSVTTSVSTTSGGGAAGATGGQGGIAGSGGRATGAGGSAGGTGGRTTSTSSTGGGAGTGGGMTTGGPGTGGMGTGGAGTGGARDAGSAGASDASVDPCPALRNDVAAKLPAAVKCDPASMMTQCQDIVPGICCMTPVASKDSAASQAYLTALDKYNAAHCMTVCTLFCRTGPTYCAPDPNTGGGACAYGMMPPSPSK